MPVYLDHHAATPLCAAAHDAMAAALDTGWANPSSPHGDGRRARALLDNARRQVAEGLGAAAANVVLTSGGTEACNSGVLGLCPVGTGHVVTTSVEHPAVARAVDSLERAGARVTRLPPGADAAALERAIEADTRLVAVQWVNHELGSIWPVQTYGALCAERGVPLFIDGTQALGKLPVQVGRTGATAVAFAAHKMGGPAGAGALWLRRGATLHPRLLGGGQERGRRPGSPDVVAAVGFGAACTALGARLDAQPRLAQQRDALEAALVEAGGVSNRAPGERVATVANVAFRNWQAEVLVAALDLDGLQVAAGAACSSGVAAASPVIQALAPAEPWRAESSLRFSFGPEVSADDTEFSKATVLRVLSRGQAENAP